MRTEEDRHEQTEADREADRERHRHRELGREIGRERQTAVFQRQTEADSGRQKQREADRSREFVLSTSISLLRRIALMSPRVMTVGRGWLVLCIYRDGNGDGVRKCPR
jgi:hypothetical protein